MRGYLNITHIHTIKRYLRHAVGSDIGKPKGISESKIENRTNNRADTFLRVRLHELGYAWHRIDDPPWEWSELNIGITWRARLA